MYRDEKHMLDTFIGSHGGGYLSGTDHNPIHIDFAFGKSRFQVMCMNFRLWAIWKLKGGNRHA